MKQGHQFTVAVSRSWYYPGTFPHRWYKFCCGNVKVVDSYLAVGFYWFLVLILRLVLSK